MSLDSTRSRLLVSYLGVGMYEYNIHGASPQARRPRHYEGHWQSSFYVRSGWGPNDESVVSSSTSGSLYVWDASRRRRTKPIEFIGHELESTAVTWNQHDPTMLASCSDDNTIRVWRMNRAHGRMRKRGETYYSEDDDDDEDDSSDSDEGNLSMLTASGKQRRRMRRPVGEQGRGNKRRSSNNDPRSSHAKRQKEDGESSSSWSTSSSQPGVQSSIFRYLQRTNSPNTESP